MSEPIHRTWSGWIEAFQIFAKYTQDDKAFCMGMGKQVIAGPYFSGVDEKDIERLEELGWEPDGNTGTFYHI